jgi:hypothetical protein
MLNRNNMASNFYLIISPTQRQSCETDKLLCKDGAKNITRGEHLRQTR